jgi:hypothetical protein
MLFWSMSVIIFIIIEKLVSVEKMNIDMWIVLPERSINEKRKRRSLKNGNQNDMSLKMIFVSLAFINWYINIFFCKNLNLKK